jgi:peptide/nickel transport system substrate-binding protein
MTKFSSSPIALDRRRFLGATAAGATAALIGIPTRARAAGKDTLVVSSGGEAITLDPHISFDGTSPLLWRASYETLLKYDGGSLDIIPNLAESFSISEDRLTYTFKVRPGVKFTDGEPLDAAAVKFNIERQIAVEQGIAYAFWAVEGIETPDDMTVVIKLNTPQDGFLSAFSSTYSPYMISPKAIKEHEEDGDWAQGWLRHNMVGTGPYILKSYTQAQQAVFERNPDYWQGWDGEHFERLVVKYIQESTTTRLLIEQGEIDISLFLPDDVVEALDGKPGIRVTDEPSFNLYYIVLPTHVGPTQDLRVRKAISHGFDYKTWTQDMMRGKAQQARGPLPSNFAGFDPAIPQYEYDPAKAKQLLEEAGYPGGGFTLKYTYETGYWWKRPLGELFQANMRDLGITVEIQELSPSAWVDLLANPEVAEHAYGLVWWPTLNSPADYLWSMYHSGGQGTAGFNWGNYKNEEVDSLLDAAPAEADPQKAQEMYSRLQQLIVEDAPALFVYEKNYRLPIRDNVEGFVFNGVYIEMLDFYTLHKS